MIPYRLAMLLVDDDLGLVFDGVVDVVTATLIGRWSNVITARAFTGLIIVSAHTGPITARAETKAEL